MKNFKIVLFVVLVVQFNLYAQLPVKTSKYNSNLKTKIVGSPYTQKMFAQAKVGSIDQKTFMRYNVFNDEFEFISAQKDTLILDKIEDFGIIVFPETNKKFQLVTYTNSKNKLFYGYLQNLKDNNGLAIFKKENIQYVDEKIAKTSMEVNMPAKYVKIDDTFFLKNKEKGTSEFPENKKGLLKLFPDKKEAIETFLKENKIDFDSESDLMKIIDFIATF